MPADVKPLFRPDALRPHLERFAPPPAALAARPKLAGWAQKLAAGQFDKLKETELLPGFVTDVFEGLLGYLRPPADPYTLKREALVKVDGKFADAGLGRFTDTTTEFVAALEGKGPLDPLDRPFAGRKRSAVEQALQYAVQLRIDWYLVTNLKETRLYHKGHDTFTYEKFETARLATDDAELRRFVFLVGAERVVPPAGPCHLDALLAESKAVGRKLTNDFYAEYRALRERTFDALREHNPGRPPAALLAATQKVLDRVLFVAFCEDRGLLPGGIIARAYQNADPFNPRPIWQNFVGLFRAVDAGSQHLHIERYNGGLFAVDEFLDTLAVPDAVCEGFKKLAEYEYGTSDSADAKLIDVEILGHIFEQSITDLEELHAAVSGDPTTEPARAGPSKRKKEGAFYTPDFVTRFIVAETLGPVLRDRFEAYRARAEAAAPPKTRGLKPLLADPAAFDPAALTVPQRDFLVAFWEGWIDALESVRVVDPSCGSGAFLIEAFDQMFAQYERAQGYLTSLKGPTLFDVRRTILTRNLFGMDLNSEAVEIARLSCWIKTAEKGKELTTLDGNIVRGNSVVADPSPLEGWRARFPAAFADGGFDVVIGNPPYVRQEWIKADKPYLQDVFASFHSTADLFVYFYELGVKLLRPGGRMGYITSGSWVRGNFGEGLRAFLAENCQIESLIDFGEYQPFADAEMIRPTIAVLAKRPPGGSMRLFKWLTSGKPPENLSDVIRAAPQMRTDGLGREAWELESEEAIELRKKLAASGQTVKDYAKGQLFRGVTTGLNEAFVIGEDQRTTLISADPRSAEIIKPFVQGTNLRPWYVENSAEYLVFTRRGIRIEDYPAVLDYLSQHRTALEPMPADWPDGKEWRGRKAGSYQWYEIQDSVDYWPAFEQPKIVWPDITNRPRFSMDLGRQYLGNTGYVIPGADYYLLGVLASWATWFFVSKTAQPLRLRSDRWQYRLIAQFMEAVPVPNAAEPDRAAVARLAEACNSLGRQRYQIEEAVRHRLSEAFGRGPDGRPLGKLNEKSQEWWEHPLPVLGDALKQSFKLPRSAFASPKTADEWEPYLAEKNAEVSALRRQLADAEREINERVYRLFELTPDEIRLLQREVEH